MTDEQCNELERLCREATTGQWSVKKDAAFIEASRTAIPALLADLREARARLGATERELERWRHGVTIEGDFVCPDSLRLDEARRLLERARRFVDYLSHLSIYGVSFDAGVLLVDIDAHLGKVGAK